MLSKALLDFAIDSFKLIYKPTSNVIYSPYSLFVDMSMVACISKGNTFRQIKEGLRIPKLDISQEELGAETRSLTSSLEKKESTALPLFISSNGVWANSAFGFNQEDFEIANKYFETKIEPVAFPQPACKIINAAVEKQTNGLIKDFLDEAALSAKIQFVLTNSAYFKAEWLEKFTKSSTSKSTFTSLNQSRSIIDMMHQSGSFNYAESGVSQLLSMDYADSDFSLVIALPRENSQVAFDTMITNLGSILDAVKQMKKMQVDVFIPKFKMEWGTESLKQCLKSMGIIDAFTAKAEFPSKASISDVLQKAVFICDENGTEAAAATAVIMNKAIPRFGRSEATTFKADHPFAFFLYNRKDCSILFEGSVVAL